MLKEAKIIETHVINMYCDKCGANMGEGVFRGGENGEYDFTYACKCGNVQTSKQKYPMFRQMWNESKAVEIEEGKYVGGLPE